ncbi:hypothetical protein [Kitasatospora sp. NPDC017646]|uniref:hypothetical protein n=1 Tax=Kitasatospora sp. NPDC017646 TaxID=3364024 RepID=UPI0037A7687E
MPDLCDQVVAEIPSVQGPDALIEAQRRVLEAADGRPVALAGERVTSAAWFAALRFLTAVVRSAATDSHLAVLPSGLAAPFASRLAERRARGAGGGQLTTGPVDALEAGAVLLLVDGVVGAPDREEASEKLRPWIEALMAQTRAKRYPDPVRKIPRPAVLAELVASVTPRTRRVLDAAPVQHAGSAALEPRHVPHLMVSHDYDELVAPLLPGVNRQAARRLSALALARLGRRCTWLEAGDVIGMDRLLAKRASSGFSSRVADPDGFWAAVGEAAARMRERGLVDYARRREALADLRTVPRVVMFAASRPAGVKVTTERCRYGAVWLWTELTSGDVREAPAYAGAWHLPATGHGWWQYRRKVEAKISDALLEWGLGLVDDREE